MPVKDKAELRRCVELLTELLENEDSMCVPTFKTVCEICLCEFS